METFLLFAAGFIFIQCLAEFVNANKTVGHYLAGTAYFLLSLILLHMAGRHSDFFSHHPEFFGLSVPAVTWMGPVLYYYMALSLELDQLVLKRFLMELAPGLIVGITILLSHPSHFGLLYSDINEMKQPSSLAIRTVLFSLLYTGYFIFRFIMKLRESAGSLMSTTRFIMPILKSFILIFLFALVIGTFAFALESFYLLSMGHILLALLLFYFYLYRRRHPELMANWLTQLQQEKYRKSQLGDIDLQKLHRELDSLFTVEQIYKDETLTLESLAERLKLSRHQLSEFFNSERKAGFTETVNSSRVDDAKKLLGETDHTILRIGYDVGFASVSAFNRNFRKFTGSNPGEYRTQNQK